MQRDQAAEPLSRQDSGDIERKAAAHGIDVFRRLLEDDDEHYEDALRVGMQAAAGEALRLRAALDEEETGRG